MGLICIRVARLSTGDTRRVVRDRGEFNAPYTLIATVVSNVYFMSDILRAAVTLVLIPQPPSFCPFFFFYSYDHVIFFCLLNAAAVIITIRFPTATCVSFSLSLGYGL